MTAKNFFRYRLDASIEGDIEYDTAKPETYTAALAKVQSIRNGLMETGAKITKAQGKPVVVRD